ncbi:amidohydrolase family protein [Candidatus Fukatsuia symbiotica]|uniref:amidohydrolase family protein n=1 Tax=Candidatus Fukatsuia symbiotica TaxID=1878942 RepID=UPI0019678C2F|nr:amidohydrolase family protein [Candidatus Fukatsuia symbiotica]
MRITMPIPTPQETTLDHKKRFLIPWDACDSHVHVIGSQDRYPMLSSRAYTPPEAQVADLQAHLSTLHMSRVVLIQPSFYGSDNRCLVAALQQLGNIARGVVVIDEKTSDKELSMLTINGVRGVRMNLESIGVRSPQAAHRELNSLATRIAPYGWHIQIYASSHVIAASINQISTLPVHVVLDHFAMIQPKKGLNQPDFLSILELVQTGKVYVKLSAPYRISQAVPDYSDVLPFASAFIEAHPDRMLWASDWPHTRRTCGNSTTEPSPFRVVDDQYILRLLQEWVPSKEIRKKILVDNPACLYGF